MPKYFASHLWSMKNCAKNNGIFSLKKKQIRGGGSEAQANKGISKVNHKIFHFSLINSFFKMTVQL